MTKDPARLLPRPQFPHDLAKAVREGRHMAPALRGGLCTGHSWHPAASRSPEKRSHAGAVAGPGQEPGSEALPQLSATRMGLGVGAGGGRGALLCPTSWEAQPGLRQLGCLASQGRWRHEAPRGEDGSRTSAKRVTPRPPTGCGRHLPSTPGHLGGGSKQPSPLSAAHGSPGQTRP